MLYGAMPGRHSGTRRQQYETEGASIIVLFSANDGVTWQPVAFDPPNGEVTIAVDSLPGGERCVFRVIGTAELQSATADTEPFSLARTPRRLYLDVPSPSQRQQCVFFRTLNVA